MLKIHVPEYKELRFRQEMMADEDTMSYNRAWGGTIPFPEEDWEEWYDYWIVNHEGKRFYRYVQDAEGRFVGEIAYHYDREEQKYITDVIIHAKYRGRGYGGAALDLLCDAAKESGVTELYDNIAVDNPAIGMFIRHGFSEDYRTEDAIFLKKTLK